MHQGPCARGHKHKVVPTHKVTACGYEVDLDDVRTLIDTKLHMAVPAGTSKMGLYFGSGSIGARRSPRGTPPTRNRAR